MMTREALNAAIDRVIADVVAMLVEKNAAYGDSALRPLRFFSNAIAEEQLLVRIDDKLSRIVRGNGCGNEDAEKDALGYLLLLAVSRQVRSTFKEDVARAGGELAERVKTSYAYESGTWNDATWLSVQDFLRRCPRDREARFRLGELLVFRRIANPSKSSNGSNGQAGLDGSRDAAE